MQDILTLFIVFVSGYVIFLTIIMALFRLFFHGITTVDEIKQAESPNSHNALLPVGDYRHRNLSELDVSSTIKGMIRQ